MEIEKDAIRAAGVLGRAAERSPFHVAVAGAVAVVAVAVAVAVVAVVLDDGSRPMGKPSSDTSPSRMVPSRRLPMNSPRASSGFLNYPNGCFT